MSPYITMLIYGAECRFNTIKRDDRGNTMEHGLILCLQLGEGWDWGRIGRGALLGVCRCIRGDSPMK